MTSFCDTGERRNVPETPMRHCRRQNPMPAEISELAGFISAGRYGIHAGPGKQINTKFPPVWAREYQAGGAVQRSYGSGVEPRVSATSSGIIRLCPFVSRVMPDPSS